MTSIPQLGVVSELTGVIGNFRTEFADRRLGQLSSQSTIVANIVHDVMTAQLALLLKQLAGRVSLQELLKHVRGSKCPLPNRMYSGTGQHVATANLLARRQQ